MPPVCWLYLVKKCSITLSCKMMFACAIMWRNAKVVYLWHFGVYCVRPVAVSVAVLYPYSLLMCFCMFLSYCCVCMHLVSWWLCNALKHIICFQNICLFVKMSVRPSHLWVMPKWFKISKYTSQSTIEDVSSEAKFHRPAEFIISPGTSESRSVIRPVHSENRTITDMDMS